MSIFDAITHAVKDVAIETAVPILPHAVVDAIVDIAVTSLS